MSEVLYLDVDDVILDTANYVRCRASKENIHVPDDASVYDSVPKDLLKAYLSEYEKIPYKKSFPLYIDKVKRLFKDIVILSEYYNESERDSKYNKISKLFEGNKIKLIDARVSRKFEEDLSDGIIVDDNVTILNKVKANGKICFWCPDTSVWSYSGSRVENNHKIVYNWSELYTELMFTKTLLEEKEE